MLGRAASQRPDGASGEEPGVEGVRAVNCRDAAAEQVFQAFSRGVAARMTQRGWRLVFMVSWVGGIRMEEWMRTIRFYCLKALIIVLAISDCFSAFVLE